MIDNTRRQENNRKLIMYSNTKQNSMYGCTHNKYNTPKRIPTVGQTIGDVNTISLK